VRFVDGVTTMGRRGPSPLADAYATACVVAARGARLTRWSHQKGVLRAHAMPTQQARWLVPA
jgi:hypothetical protein